MGLVPSILIYLCIFFIAVAAAYISEKFIDAIDLKKGILVLKSGRLVDVLYYNKTKINSSNSGNVIMVIIFSAIAIAVPCILSALRDTSVGMDVIMYVTPNFELAQKNRDLSFFQYFDLVSEQVEIFFALLIYLCAKINSIGLLFFLIQFLVIAPMYFALFLLRNSNSISFSYFVYLFLFYNFSLSGMRQSIAMSFLILSFAFFSKKKYISSLVSALLSAQFHNSAYIIMVMFLVVALVARTYDSSRQKKLFRYMIIFLAAVFIFYRVIAESFAAILFLFVKRYSYYILHFLEEQPFFAASNIPWSDFLPKMLLFLIGLYMLLPKRGNKFKFNSYAVSLLIYVAIGRYFALMNANFYEAERIAFYFDIFLILFLSYVIKLYNTKKQSHFSCVIIISSICVVYWLYFIMLSGSYGTSSFCFR